ncbi:MAG: extracellular solute-binding protein [Clostridia bacterium]|nr:extracellular solute-binding protein [Clostridia bacterium]MBQ9429163.1 extracellular solute-binding protein [Clostridia bacterium]
MKKGLALLLCGVMLFSALVSCGGGNTPAQTEETQQVVDDQPDLPEDLDLAGDFHILVSGNYARNDFQSESDEGTAVQIAIYRRNAFLKEKYGIDITNEDVVKFGSSTGSGTGFNKIYTAYMAGESAYDAAMIGTYDVATLAYSGYIHDLNELNYLDLSKVYWDQAANRDLAVLGRMFYTTGEISIVDNLVTHAILFNKDMIKSYNLENPYDLVHADNWTLETFGGLVKSIGEDLDNNGIYDEKDRYGLLTWNDPMVAILASSGDKIATVGEDGKIALTLYSERVIDLYDKFENIVFDQAHAYNYQYDNVSGAATPSAVWNTNRDAIFTENRALFYLNTMATVERHRDSDVDFGVLPYPKYDADQEEYGHMVSAYHSQFVCVPESAKDFDRSGAVLELLAWQGQELLTPAYYEQTLVGKSVRDEESVEMLDIIFATHVYDIGAYYDIGTYKTQLGRLFVSRAAISSMYETYRSQAETKIAQINEIFAQNEE